MIRSISVVALSVCLILGTGGALAQAKGHEEHHPKGGTPAPRDDDHGTMSMDGRCKMMQEEMERMQMGMHQSQEHMHGMMEEMNKAKGRAKTDAMARMMNEMSEHMDRMQQMHTDMMSKMMEHMTEHMMQGASPKARQEMMMCPMMKGHDMGLGEKHEEEKPSKDKGKKAPKKDTKDDHSAHHPPA